MKFRWGWKIPFQRLARPIGAAPLIQNEAVRRRLEFRQQMQQKTVVRRARVRWRTFRFRGGGWVRWLVLPGLAGALYLVFGSGFFWLDTLKITGSHLATQEEIRSLMFPKGFQGINAVSWPEGIVAKRLLSKIPQINEIHFRKNIITDTLTVQVREHQTSIVWQTAGEKFLVNRYGVVYDQAGENTPLIIVEDLKNLPVSLNQKIVTPDFIEFVTSFVANLPRKTNIAITRITIPETTFEVEMYTNQKWRIILDTTRPPDDQLNALVRVLQEKQDTQPREYIDLRIPNKVFYK